MAQIVDAFISTLGLDTKEFTKGKEKAEVQIKQLTKTEQEEQKKQLQAEKKASEELKKREIERNKQAKETIKAYRSIRNQALSLFALFTAGKGMKDFIEDTIRGDAALQYMSENVGMSVRELSGWGLAMENVGGSASEMRSQIAQSATEIARFKEGLGDTPQLEAYFKFGGNVYTPAREALKNTHSFMLAQARLMQNLVARMGERGALAAAGQMGISANMFNVLKRGPEYVERQVQANEKLTGVTGEQTEKGREMLRTWNGLMAQFQSTGRVMLYSLMPAFREILKYMKEFATWAQNNQGTIKAWVTTAVTEVEKLVGALTKVATIYNNLSGKKATSAISYLNPLTGATNIGQSIGHFLGSMFSRAPVKNNFAGSTGGWGGGAVHNNVSSETRINHMEIHTQATDAHGIMRDAKTALHENNLAIMSNTGVW